MSTERRPRWTGQPTRPSVSVEQGWHDRRSEIMAEASTRLVRALVFGDSLGAGYYASNFRDKAFTALISDALQARYGDGGSGWIDSAWESFVFLPDASGAVTTTGAWTAVVGGPNGGGRRPTVAGNGATVTSPFRGTTLDMVQRRGAGFGQWTYSIDGGAPVAVSAANATADLHTTTVTGLAPGDHTVTQAATSGDCRLFGIRGRNATGVVLDRYCRASAAYVNPAANLNMLAAADGLAGQTSLSTTFGMYSTVDLVILALGVNDALDTEVTTAGLEAVLHTLWDRARRLGPDGEPPLFVVMIPHVGKHDDADTSPEYPRVATVLRRFGEAIGAAVVDVWAEGRRSWDYWNSLGAWGDFLGSPDAIHLSDVGHELMAASTIDLLT